MRKFGLGWHSSGPGHMQFILCPGNNSGTTDANVYIFGELSQISSVLYISTGDTDLKYIVFWFSGCVLTLEL